MFHCTRAALLAATAVTLAVGTAARAEAQAPSVSNFTVYVRSQAIGTEQVTVTRSSEGFTVSSTGRVAPPIDLTSRQFTARYDDSFRPLELSLDATVRGRATTLHATVDGTQATTEVSGGPDGQPQRLTDTIEPLALFMMNPLVAPFEAVAARLASASPGATISFYQPGQGTFTGLVGESTAEQIQTVDRVINVRRTLLTLQAGGQPPLETEIWADEAGRLLRLSIPAQGLVIARSDMTAVSTRRVTMSRPNDEDIRIPANGFSLAATLSKPEGKSGRLPTVILVPGSGPTDRDENVAGIAIFGQLAHALADAGFAVVRYDKRGIGQSGGRTESATLTDYAEDVRAIIRALNDRKDVDSRRIALVGHSEGGSLAMLVAAKEKRIAGVALVATIATTGAELNMYQVAHALERAKRPEAERTATLELQRRIQEAVLTGKGWETLSVPDAVRRQADTPYFQSFLSFDPAKVMRNFSQPVLILQGTLDTQVPPSHADTLETLAKARSKAGPVEVVKVPGVNHLLVPAVTGEADEYSRLGSEKVSPQIITALTTWLTRTLPAK